MTREEAIKVLGAELKERSAGYYDYLQHYGHKDKAEEAHLDALYMAIAALREQEERSKGCEYCDGSGKHFLVDDDIPFGSYNSIRLYDGKAFLDDADGFEIRIKFCPMCGRRLGEV